MTGMQEVLAEFFYNVGHDDPVPGNHLLRCIDWESVHSARKSFYQSRSDDAHASYRLMHRHAL
ncbi:hypothetical protein [Microvirga calopogonii]|uniref:hypothetical protein n=1 Tax=Microvirga calopogonii TaxID=2078013 RepID=UPI000E0CD633|nr:hypothetical protein [Microvirga calopogonii]